MNFVRKVASSREYENEMLTDLSVSEQNDFVRWRLVVAQWLARAFDLRIGARHNLTLAELCMCMCS